MDENLKKIEEVLDEKVRPILRAHGGEISVDRLENESDQMSDQQL